MTQHTDLPGAGLSYPDLCGSTDPKVRETWSLLGDLAEVLGMSTVRPGSSPRSKTVDELVADLAPVLPPDTDPLAAAEATRSLFPEVPERKKTYEVRHLLAVDDRVEWALVTSFEDKALAEHESAYWGAQTGDLYLVVEVTTTLSRAVAR